MRACLFWVLWVWFLSLPALSSDNHFRGNVPGYQSPLLIQVDSFEEGRMKQELQRFSPEYSPEKSHDYLGFSTASLSLLTAHTFYKLSESCGGLNNKNAFFVQFPMPQICGVGGTLSTVTLFALQSFRFPWSFAPSEILTHSFDNSKSRKLQTLSKVLGELAIGGLASIPMFYLNHTKNGWLVAFTPTTVLILWDSLAATSSGLAWVWSLDTAFKNWIYDPLMRWRLNVSDQKYEEAFERVERFRCVLKKRLKLFAERAVLMNGKKLKQVTAGMTETPDPTRVLMAAYKMGMYEDEPTTITCGTALKKAMGFGAGLVGFISGYGNWPLSKNAVIDLFKYYHLSEESTWVNLLSNGVGVSGFLTTAALNAIASYEVFEKAVSGLKKCPAWIKATPHDIKDYFTKRGCIRDKIAPFAKVTLNLAAMYLAAASSFPQIAITLMAVSPGLWNEIVQVSSFIGGFTSCYYCLNVLVNTTTTRLFGNDEAAYLDKVMQIVLLFQRHIDYFNTETLFRLEKILIQDVTMRFNKII